MTLDESIHPGSGDVEAAADVQRNDVEPKPDDVLQARVRQLPAVPEVELLQPPAPGQKGLDGRISDVEARRQVHALTSAVMLGRYRRGLRGVCVGGG